MEMHRADWLLLLLAVRDAAEPLDPVRLQKGMFLLANETQLPQAQRYDFFAYDYGPFSVDLYRDLDLLHRQGMIERMRAPGYTWFRYRPTLRGLGDAERIVGQMDASQRSCAKVLQRLKHDVLRRGFRELLEYVYERYPEYAENSVFER